MKTLLATTSALFVLGFFLAVSFLSITAPASDALTGSTMEGTYPYLSVTTKTPLQAYTTYTTQPTTQPVKTMTVAEIEQRFAGMLSHVRWLMNNKDADTLLRKQIYAVMDDTSEDLNDLEERLSGNGGTLSVLSENLTLGSYYLSGDGDDEGILINGAGGVQLTAALLDTSGDAGVAGQLLLSTGAGTNWVSTSTLGISGSLSNNSVTPDYILVSGQTDEYCLTYETTGDTFEWQTCGAGGGLASTDIDTSAELAAILTDETGTGAFVLAGSPTFTGTLTAANANFSGNIGIGTTTPNQKLTVEGSINLSSATGAIFFDDTKYIYASPTNDSVVFGENAGATFTSGTTENIAIGLNAGRYASTTDDSVYIGSSAGQNNSGWGSVLLGYQTGENNNNWSVHAIGYQAGRNNTGNENNFMGYQAGYQNTGESGNFFGSYAGYNNTGLFNNNLFGYGAGYNNTGDENNIFGMNAGYNNTGSYLNVFGENAGRNNTGSSNNFLGRSAGHSNSGDNNTFLGAYAGRSNNGFHNYLIGYNAGYNNVGSVNFIAGPDAGYNNTGSNNFIVGDDAGYNNAGTENFIFGTNAGYSNSGSSNFIVGASAGYSSTGNNNLIIGEEAGYNNGGNGNILLGYRVANNLSSGNRNIVIGYDIDSAQATTSNTLNIGNLIFGTGLDGTGTSLSSGNIGIGNVNPTAKLTVNATTTATSGFENWGTSVTLVTNPSGASTAATTASFAANKIPASVASGFGNITGSYGSAENFSSQNGNALSGTYGYSWSSGGSQNNILGANGDAGLDGGSATWVAGLSSWTGVYSGATATNLAGVYVSGMINSGGTITSRYGVYLASPAGSATNDFGFYQSGTQKNYFAGNVGIGTTSPYAKLSVTGDIALTGGLYDSSASRGTNGMVLLSTGTGVDWVATSSLGISGGSSFSDSAQLAALLSDETGTGVSVFNTSPTFESSLTVGSLGSTALLSVTGDLGGTIQLGTEGVTIFDDNDGAITFLGTGNGFDEGLTLNLDDTSNTGVFTSSTGLNILNFSGIGLQESGSNVISIGDLDTCAEFAALGALETGTCGSVVLSASPTLTGTVNTADITASGRLTMSGTAANIALGSNWLSGDGDDEGIFVDVAGNVGVGTSTTNQKLTVNGNINIDRISGLAYALQFNGVSVFSAHTRAGAYGHNLMVGESAGASFTATAPSTDYNVAVGYQASQNVSNFNADYTVAIGYQAGQNNTNAKNNFIGMQAGQSNTGQNNNFIGEVAGQNSTGSHNNGIGYAAGRDGSGSYNNAIGHQAASNLTAGSYNNYIGGLSGQWFNGSYNNAIGYFAGRVAQGSENIFIGTRAGEFLYSTSSVAIGSYALYGNADSNFTAFTSLNNVAIGYRAGYAADNGSGNNILIGYQVADNLTTGNNNIIIGYDIDNVTATTDNALNIGNLIFGTGLDGTGTTLSSGNIGIGLTNPLTRLNIKSGSADNLGGLMITANGSSNYPVLLFENSSNGGQLDLQDSGNVTATRISANANSYFTGGNVGIGTTSPAQALSVVGQIVGTSDITLNYGRTGNGNLVVGAGTSGISGVNFNDGTNSGIVRYDHSNDSMQFFTSTAERMRITSLGNVGISTTSPTNTLSVTGTMAVDSGGHVLKYYNGSGVGYLGLTTNSDLGLITNGSERVRITNTGNIGIGTTTPSQKLQVFGDIRVGTAGANGCLEDYGGGVIAGTCSSDERLKKDIQSIAQDGKSYLEKITALTPVTYNWNETAAELYKKDENVANLGLIAQDVEAQFPELVSWNSDGYRQVDFRALPFYLIEAMRELWAKVQGHDERIENLEQENEYLKSRLNEIEDELNVTPPPAPTPEPAPQPSPEPTPTSEPAPEPSPETPTEPTP